MEMILKLGEWALSRSDPLLVLCLIVLALWQRQTSKLLAEHLDPKNKEPHPQCAEGEKAYQTLCDQIETQRGENREDFQEIRALLMGSPEAGRTKEGS